ncbi:MAG: amidohydrolase [Desulfobacterales bacterium]|nr:amidohydrolase [Desulfobacterales bacterium]
MKDITIALAVQNSICGMYEENLSKCIKLTAMASKKGASLILFPEMNLTGYASGKKLLPIAKPLSDELISTLRKISTNKSITIVAGLAHKESDNKIYASHFAIMPDNSFFIYKKTHTAPPEKKTLSRGNKIEICQDKSNDLYFGIQLCYDAHFPQLTTSMAVKGADLVFIPHASPRGTAKEKYQSWMRHLTARAFDNGIFIAACNQTGENGAGLLFPGVAVIIGPDGKIISKYTEKKEGLLISKLSGEKLKNIRNHRMKYFLPNRRDDLY